MSINKIKPDDIKITNTIYGNGYNMYISNDPYNDGRIPKILANFKIADEQICSIPLLYFSKYELYTLDGNIHKYYHECTIDGYTINHKTENSIRYHEIDSISIYDLYKDNGIIDLINQSGLVNYGFDINKNFRPQNRLHLYVRRFYGFNKTCLKERLELWNFNQLDELESKHSISDSMKYWGY